MRTVRLLFSLLLVVLSTGSLSAAELREKPGASPISGSLPFRLCRGYAVVTRAWIGERQINALIDTGANPTIIDDSIAGIPTAEGLFELPLLRLGPLMRHNLRTRVHDLEFVRTYIGVPVDAIVGMDVLAVTNFTIDYDEKKILFGFTPLDGFTVPLESGPPLVTVALAVGNQQLSVLLGSGASGLMLFKSRAGSNRLPGVRLIDSARGRNLDRLFAVDQLLLQNVQLGPSRLELKFATIAEDWPEWDSTFDGLLGVSALKFKRVTFDFEAGVFRWLP